MGNTITRTARQRYTKYAHKIDPYVTAKRLAQVYELASSFYLSEAQYQEVMEVMSEISDLPPFIRKKLRNYTLAVLAPTYQFKSYPSINEIMILARRYDSLPELGRIVLERLIKAFEPAAVSGIFDKSYLDLCRYASYIGDIGVYSRSNYDHCLYG